MKRFWDPTGNYKTGHIKSYHYWVLEISFRQHTLGSYIIFAARNIEKISELTGKELNELTLVMKEIETALSSIEEFNPDRFNYLQLGNNLHNLHFHGIPRYKTRRLFAGRTWIDSTYGHSPLWLSHETDPSIVQKIKERIQKEL